MVGLGRGGERENCKISLLGKDSKSIHPDYNNGIIISRDNNLHLSSPWVWARRIIDNYLAQRVADVYEEYAGSVVHMMAVLKFPNHTIRLNGFPEVRLTGMHFDFGERMRLPQMSAESLELKTIPDEARRLVHEKGKGKIADVSIVYEPKEDESHSIYLHSSDEEKKTIIIALEA